jgi:hypothetical protein
MPKEYQEKFTNWERNTIYKAPEIWVSGSSWTEYIYYLTLHLPKLSKDNYKKYPWLEKLHDIYKNYIKS